MMSKSNVTNIYTMEDLIPIVGELAEKFTSKESSSVTYERAVQFMEAVIYCIAHFESEGNLLAAPDVISAREAYYMGYDAVVEKVRRTQGKYNKLMKFFDHYGNRNYRDTVEKALRGFFLYYDAMFAPTDNIITMDYPVFLPDTELEGIDMIEQYIDLIWEEQCYLNSFPRSYVIGRLRSFHEKYENEFFNLKEIVELSEKI